MSGISSSGLHVRNGNNNTAVTELLKHPYMQTHSYMENTYRVPGIYYDLIICVVFIVVMYHIIRNRNYYFNFMMSLRDLQYLTQCSIVNKLENSDANLSHSNPKMYATFTGITISSNIRKRVIIYYSYMSAKFVYWLFHIYRTIYKSLLFSIKWWVRQRSNVFFFGTEYYFFFSQIILSSL